MSPLSPSSVQSTIRAENQLCDQRQCLYVIVQNADGAHTHCVGLYFLYMLAWWTIVALSCMVYTEHTPQLYSLLCNIMSAVGGVFFCDWRFTVLKDLGYYTNKCGPIKDKQIIKRLSQ